ncbi:MAG: DUF6390 family protein [Pseudonocardia sp.]|nr:DUF6390 family protein [Pseudonocardia sp.]
MPPAAPGEVLFARYAYPPTELGYCGPADAEPVFDVAAGAGGPGPDVRAFDGAVVYLEVIAAANGLAPLDPRVVEAYWVGNELLDEVDPAGFVKEVRVRFAGEAGPARDLRTGGTSAVPHHSFQVFTVYPWVRLLPRGGPALHILDRCRIRDGTVLAVDGDEVVVRSRPLTWDGHALGLGDPVEERARWARAGRGLPDAVAPGDTVALHWDWVCDRLTPRRRDELRRRTAAQLALTNAARTSAAQTSAARTNATRTGATREAAAPVPPPPR